MPTDRLSRRHFLTTTAAGAAALAASRPTPARAAEPPRVLCANDRVRVAVLAPGDRAQALISDFLRHAGELNMDLVGVCDLWPRQREAQAAKWAKATGHPIAQYRNTDEL